MVPAATDWYCPDFYWKCLAQRSCARDARVDLWIRFQVGQELGISGPVEKTRSEFCWEAFRSGPLW
jgi:hypothetical protein